MLKAKPYFAWFDFWIGAYYDRAKHRLYISPFPSLGLCIQLGAEVKVEPQGRGTIVLQPGESVVAKLPDTGNALVTVVAAEAKAGE